MVWYYFYDFKPINLFTNKLYDFIYLFLILQLLIFMILFILTFKTKTKFTTLLLFKENKNSNYLEINP